VELALDDSGEGTPVVLLHGLTATRRYVVMGSTALQRGNHRVVAYDARGHGGSDPAPLPSEYEYADLASDLVGVLDERGISRAVLAGASMGAHTALRFALQAPDRVAGLVVITPAYDPADMDTPGRLERWDALAAGLRSGGVEGFVAAYCEAASPSNRERYGEPDVPGQWHETIFRVIRQRLSQHEHPEAVADALEVVPRSHPFDIDALASIDVPTVIVADRDEADPGHPLSVGEDYARRIPGASLVVEEEGRSPIAWQGGQLSRVIADLAARATF
jgi:pimeloyl-ACP methyl ester carboxylesterase